MGKSLYLECYSGISGDMTVAALLDLGADQKVLEDVLESLPVQGFEIKVNRVMKSGIDACDFDVILNEEIDGHDHDMEHDHDHEHHHHHHADEVFTSWGKETAKKFADADMEQILKTLADNADEYGIILRAKGIVPNTDGEWIHFDLTPGEYEIRKGAADYTGKLCVIGSNLKEDKLAELFGVA